ncbi:porin [Candidatus Pelagibacter sp.]|nr:porin [Candidatus Pelagibacter sp.]
MNTNKKEYFMNKFKKIGLTALAGSLAAVSAQAGELSVTGGANATLKWGSGDRHSEVTGKSLGTDKDVAFTGSGELDNGTTFSVFTATNDSQTDLTSGAMSISTPSFGSFLMGHHSGAAHYKYDEEVPQAYEQISDITSTVTQNKVGDFMDNNHITYTSPSLDLGGASITLDIGYAFDANDTETSDGGVAHTTHATYGAGKEAGITIKYDALQLGVYGAERENNTPQAAGTDAETDEFNGVWYAKYSFGPVSIGYSEFYIDAGITESDAVATSAAKTLRTSAGLQEGHQIGIAFNVNDNLSVSYTESEETYDAQDDASTAIADVTQEIDAIQFAYSMGGMSVKAYQMDVTNPGFDEDAGDTSVTEIALGLAF